MSWADLVPVAIGGMATLTGLGALYAAVKRVPPPSGPDAYQKARERAAAARRNR